jgi:hypothetical protein
MRGSNWHGWLMALAVAVAPCGTAAQTPPPGMDDAELQAFAASLGSVVFAAGQLVVRARACGEEDEAAGLDLRRRVIDRARECAASDARAGFVADNMSRAFEGMLGNAEQVFASRGREAVCARYRAPDLPFEIATALEMGRELSTESGWQKVAAMPCPAR